MLKRLTERLYDGVNRGPILKCFAAKSFKTRMDVLRLNAGVRDQFIDDRDCASDLVSRLVRNESASVSLELDIASEDLGKRETSLGIYYALTQGVIRGAEAIYRESGLRSLWLAYPFLLLRDITDPQNKRNILAPIYLWPIQIRASLRRQGELIICRDTQAGPPVFNRVLARWVRVNLNVDMPWVELDADSNGQIELSEITSSLRSMLSGFSNLELPDLDSNLAPLPARSDAAVLKQPAVINAATLGLFVSENQALIENLEKLQGSQRVDDPLDSILANRQAVASKLKLPAEKDRYLVTDSDPYQEIAIWESRKAPGSIVHGPPGTGKSQTIVNIVADCLARGERVLLVCQKRAAIDVVAERLRAVGLDQLCVVVHDSESDRRQIFADLKDQIAGLKEHIGGGFASERGRLAEEIDRKEFELEEYHEALQSPRSVGLSYRQLVGKATAFYNASPGLRSNLVVENLLADKKTDDLDRVERILKELAYLADTALPQVNPWKNRLRDFVLTKPLRDDLLGRLHRCVDAASDIEKFAGTNGLGVIFSGEPTRFISTAREWQKWASALCESNRIEMCASWLQKSSADGGEDLSSTIKKLGELASSAHEFARINPDPAIAPVLDRIDAPSIERLVGCLGTLDKGRTHGWWRRFIPSYRAATRIWSASGLPADLCLSGDGIAATQLQCTRWSSRRKVIAGGARFSLGLTDTMSDSAIESALSANLTACRDALKIQEGARSNSSIAELHRAIEAKDRNEIQSWARSIDTAVARAELLVALENSLNELKQWLTSEYLSSTLSEAQQGKPVRGAIESLVSFLDKVPQLCAFDAARKGCDQLTSDLLSALLTSDVEGPTGNQWAVILRYSAYSSWISKCLVETPILQSLTPEIYERNRKALADLISRKRAIEVRSVQDRWYDAQSALHALRPSPLIALAKQLVTRGPNSKRLRQAVAFGADSGIFTLRPCWMMNPNTACQIFQLNPGMFDVVIFDEASQCPLEQAVPILYRGKRVVVAGDEKQLPPTSFFLSVTPFDDDETVQDETEERSPEDQVQRDLIRDVLSTSDLLTVCDSVLRNSYLDMHYRSEHPLLIQFSNKAFYGGRLQCPPAVHSNQGSVPITVRTANGVYEKQSNEAEARSVVHLLRDLWLVEEFPGTVGVVTFNLKQEDLIQNALQAEALRDEQFRIKYEFECDRKDGRQDVSFFVKNLESVQGDERDVMIFSTTFGLDPTGQFKRFFGPLNREGGEKRLNVAVTRAKKKIFIVTSLPVSQISDVFASTGSRAASKVTGRDYLQAYMRYADAVSSEDRKTREIVEQQLGELARMSGFAVGHADAVLDFDSDFEISVFDALTKKGLKVDQQVGDSGFRIDLAVRHPSNADLYALGIECDGRAYHSSFTARARDIWRQQILESRGWKIHRIWSANWCMDPEAEIDKILELLNKMDRMPAPKQ